MHYPVPDGAFCDGGRALTKIIISYRRSDSDVFAGRVRDRIAGRYGEDAVFIDVDNIPFGKDFRVHIQEVMAQADAVLIVIGPKWLGTGKGGTSRIKDDTDPVRIEVETALNNGTPTIPLLVGKTNMPKPEQLPESLRDFAFINAAPVDTGRDFHRDLNRVIATINSILDLPQDTAERSAFVADGALKREPAAATPSATDAQAAGNEPRDLQAMSTPVAVDRQEPSPTVAGIISEPTALGGETKETSPIKRLRSQSWRSLVAIAGACLITVGAAFWIFTPRSRTETAASPTPQVTQETSGAVRTVSAPPAGVTASQPPPSATAAPDKMVDKASPDPGADVVRAFYAALGRGDGAMAATLVVPERQKGGLGAQAMTDFFSRNFQPLKLISVAPYGENAYQATYTFQRTAKSVVCANSVIVSVTQRSGQYLIQNIDARGGC